MSDNYEDIINLKHYEPKYHPRMSSYNRAAQFAPFAALTGYEDAIIETGRTTDKKIELDEEMQDNLNNKIQELVDNIKERPKVEVTYFIKDKRKSGGKYEIYSGNIKRIDLINNFIKFEDNKIINIEDVYLIK